MQSAYLKKKSEVFKLMLLKLGGTTMSIVPLQDGRHFLLPKNTNLPCKIIEKE